MDKINKSTHVREDHGLSQDAQGRWWELLSPTQVLTGEVPQIQPTVSKCRGNRKLQHFKRKCRGRGMNEGEIVNLTQTRTVTTDNRMQQTQKRKRDTTDQQSINSSAKSLSQLSISQPSKKIMKDNIHQETRAFNDTAVVHKDRQKASKYLRMPRQSLLRSLRLQLNLAIKKKKDQRFALSRLHLLDEKFCLDQSRYLHQTYLDLGSQYDLWPVSNNMIISIHWTYI